MLSFRDFIATQNEFVEDMDDDIKLIPVEEGQESLSGDELGIVSIWSTSDAGGRHRSALLEAVANQKVHLIGQYYVRYDPPRDASTGRNAQMKGDWHLFNKSGEIAAWDTSAKARHGFEPGTKLPKKAYNALVDQYGDLVGLKSNLLEFWQVPPSTENVVSELADAFLAMHPQVGENGMADAVRQLVADAIRAEREACAATAERLACGPTSNRPDLTELASAAMFGFKAGAANAGLAIRERYSKDPDS